MEHLDSPCPHSATQNMGGPCEACVAKRINKRKQAQITPVVAISGSVISSSVNPGFEWDWKTSTFKLHFTGECSYETATLIQENLSRANRELGTLYADMFLFFQEG